ncbi:MAG: glycosyltransferase family 4 protein, partial [Phycisphaerales bacterium]
MTLANRAIDPSLRPVRVGFISLLDPDDPRSLSGMPHAMKRAIEAEGLEVVDVGRLDGDLHLRRGMVGRSLRFLARRAESLRTWLGADDTSRWHTRPDEMERRFEQACRRRARRLTSAIERHRPDVLFGNCISSPLAFLETDLPIVYTSDATAEVISGTYPRYARFGARYAACTDHIERLALSKVRFAAFACPATLDSAITRYGVPPDRASLVPFGANLTPLDRSPNPPPTEPPCRSDLRLTITAFDPERKRVPLAIEATRALRACGWNATLTVIGPRLCSRANEGWIRFLGVIDPRSPRDRAQHRAALAESHLCLQPSLGEAYGIAPIESASFGRPSIVTDVGGLPFVVLDGETGAVVPVSIDAAGLAEAIESIASDPDRYLRLAAAARARHRAELNWSAWGRAIAA